MERRNERRGTSEQGLGVVSCSRKYSIKEDPDPWIETLPGGKYSLVSQEHIPKSASKSQSTHQKQQWCQSGS